MSAALGQVEHTWLPAPKQAVRSEGRFVFHDDQVKLYMEGLPSAAGEVVRSELEKAGFRQILPVSDEADADIVLLAGRNIPHEARALLDRQHCPDQSYRLTISGSGTVIHGGDWTGALYGLATLTSLLRDSANGSVPAMQIVDGPDARKRIISPTLTWYAGFARAGFGTQLWEGDRWETFLDWCYRHKINALNIVMYGFWPFEFPEYPETVLRDLKVQTWSKEINGWIEVSFTHPNLRKPFLEDMIRYANARGIDIYAYIGLNSYSGGYPVMHPECRGQLSSELLDSGHVNNYDSLCTSRPEVRDYLIASVKRIEQLGFNGLVFEESEEVQWFCQCADCQAKYGHLSPNDAKHTVSVDLLQAYAQALNPDTLIGVRWLREPPIVKDRDTLSAWKDKLPERVKLFWAPGLEDDDREFLKWVDVFGPERIWSRNCEGSGFAASLGRIPYIIPDTFPESLKNYAFQHLWNDISQFQGAVNTGCTGINGYGFEWYGHELFFMAAAQYGWNAWALDHDEFLAHAARHMFGETNGARYERLIRTLPCIHETQICDTLPSFPFMPNKYIGEEGKRYLEECADAAEGAIADLNAILATAGLTQEQRECAEATRIMALRMKEVIWAGIYFNRYLDERDRGGNETRRLERLADLALHHAEEDYRLIKEHYFDTKEHDWTGVAIGEYYIPMVINEYKKTFVSRLGERYKPDNDVAHIVGGESLPWEWLLEWGPKIAQAKPTAAIRS
ncbi:glycoside hydrolase family 20 zincin-like fold domain-containing protein [Paenibacillus mendelii]|uniref:Glycoside hydrolase family 20 zincin-like fold domain-containing protein n=1 Tax=Paenibacillus mendelii TaxID=206163 RepID=A0ABV6JI69_9BACL|nr:glycoside hydrolase family 20 zincin-like fold domain-containing protein [Paenibacillus mendelii]MCQ6558128.1 hypothetical protein [Paenibacillus mendelii]